MEQVSNLRAHFKGALSGWTATERSMALSCFDRAVQKFQAIAEAPSGVAVRCSVCRLRALRGEYRAGLTGRRWICADCAAKLRT